MHTVIEILLLACVTQVSADSPVDELVDRALKSGLVHADLEDSTLAKPSTLATPSRTSLATRAAPALPRAQGRPLHAARFPMAMPNLHPAPTSNVYGRRHQPATEPQYPFLWEGMPQFGAARHGVRSQALGGSAVVAASSTYDYDLVIIGCGVGGHGAALHAVKMGMKTAILEGADIGGTCVNRGCVPSKALLAAAGRIREMQDKMHMDSLGININGVSYDREKVAGHANGLAKNIQGNLERSLVALGVEIIRGHGSIIAPHQVKCGDRTISAQNVMIATGSTPFVPPGVEVDGKTVFTSDHALKLDWVPDWVAIIGSGYIGLEFSDVYTALGSEVSMIEALDNIMPGFDREIAKLAERVLIKPRKVEYYTGVFATNVKPGVPGKVPVTVDLMDAKTKEIVDTLQPDAVLVATGRAPYTNGLGLDNVKVETMRGFVPCDEKMRVTDTDGKTVEGLWCIGDANGKMMLAHAASAQGISAVENMCGRENVLDHQTVPAACFTHPEVAFVGMTQEQAEAKGSEEGFEVAVSKTSFKANSKALAELESDGMAKCIYRKDTGDILGFWIMGLHGADLIHEASNAMSQCLKVQDLKFYVHAHPTIAEVVDEVFKGVPDGVGSKEALPAR